MKPRRLLPCARFLPLLVCTAALASAPALAQKSDAEIQDDIAFAKGLAREWGFVDLATTVIERLEREGVPARQREKLGVTKCEIFEVAAINERDRQRRNELFQAALDAYADFIDKNPVSAALPQAETGFVRLSSMYARSLDISLEDAVGEEAEALRERRIEVLTSAVAKTSSLIESLRAIGLDSMSERQKAELIELMLDRGRMLLDLGTTQEDGSFSFQQAIQTLEEVVFTAGEGTPAALRAYDLIGQVFAAMQDWSSARDFFEAVVEQAIPSDLEAWEQMVKDLDLTQSDKEQRWLFVELSTQGLVEAYMAMGDTQKAAKYALHLYNTWKREGFQLSLQLGYPSLLAAARVLLDSGGWIAGNIAQGEGDWYSTEEEAKESGASKRNRIACTDLALQIAQQVNKENQGNVLQIRAQKLIASIIDQAGVVVAPAVLYEAAEGDYNERNNEAALAGFRRVLRSLEGQDEAARLEFGPKIFFRIGRTYQRMDRPLEAAMAFREGCTTYLGDPEYDSENAKGFYRSMQDVVRQSPGDSKVKSVLEAAEQLAAQLSDQDKDTIKYNLGQKAERNEDWAGAIQYYSEIQPVALDYEKALVNIAYCKLRTGQISEAEQLFDDYIENFVTDPKNDTGASQAKAAKRSDALAKAEYWRGQIAFKKAQKAGGEDNWKRVLELYGTYYERYEDQTEFSPRTMNALLEGHLALRDTEAARKIYDKLIELYPNSPVGPAAAVTFYRALNDLRTEAETIGQVDRAAKILREMAELLQFNNQNDSKPDFDKLRLESRHWLDLGEWANAEQPLAKLVRAFGSSTDADTVKKMALYVLPDLAHTYLQQHKVSQAHEILVGLVADETIRPQKRTVLDFCRAVTGWVEGEANDIQIVPGAGSTEEEFQQATDLLAAIANAVDEKWTCEWYSYQFQLAWGFYAWATADWSPTKDSRKRDTAQRILNTIATPLGTQFRGDDDVPGIDDSCNAAGGEDALLYGGERLRRRYVWLWDKVK